MSFRLADGIDATEAMLRFARNGHVRIHGFLAERDASALSDNLRCRDDWMQVIYSDGKVVELDRATRAGFGRARQEAINSAVYSGARYGFQYRYETIRAMDGYARKALGSSQAPDLLIDFAQFFSNGEVRNLLRHIVGNDAVDFADVQATAFSPGDFLTGHDDAVAGKNRIAAYVLSLNPNWRVEWGGLLLFHGTESENEPCRAFIPAFNTLDLFSVPRMHSVSEVSRAAPYRRYSLTGWLRSRENFEK